MYEVKITLIGDNPNPNFYLEALRKADILGRITVCVCQSASDQRWLISRKPDGKEVTYDG